MKTPGPIFSLFFLTLLIISVSCSNNKLTVNPKLAAFEQHLNMEENTPYNELWTFIGPEIMSGRISDIAVHPSEPAVIYAASASGGVWKSEDDGLNWKPIFEKEASSSIGDIAIAPSDKNVIYTGTGEANAYRSGMTGCGLYRSVNGGQDWEHAGLGETGTTGRIVVHPENPDIVYVAASGKTWESGPDRGVYKTMDGGQSWEKVLFINDTCGCIDLVMDPSNPDILLAAMWERKREKWNNPLPGGNDGIFKTTDGGLTWTSVTEGLPAASDAGRIGLDFAESNPDIVYAVIDNHASTGETREDGYGRGTIEDIRYGCEIYRSSDKGDSWSKVSPANEFMERVYNSYGYIFGQIIVDPTDEDRVYVLGVPLIVSDDGGISWKRLEDRGLHGDHHALWVDPGDPTHIINGNDGGVNISHDMGRTFMNVQNHGIVQFYNLEFDNSEPFNIYGSIQDNGSYCGPVTHRPGIDSLNQWKPCPGGEASHHEISQDNNDVLYSAGFYGTLSRSVRDGDKWNTTRINPPNSEGEPMQRGQWLAPFVLSQHDSKVLYLGKQHLYKTSDEGSTWEKISDDLTFNNSSEMGDINYQTIFAIGESPLQPGLLYAGTDDGRLHVTRDDGATWTEIKEGLPMPQWVSRVVPSMHNEARVYLCLNGKRDENMDAMIFASDDYGTTWKDISANIPDSPVNVIREDINDPSTIYAGTDTGVYISTDGGGSWNVFGKGLPTVYVHDLKIHPRDQVMVIATHGRGIWKINLN